MLIELATYIIERSEAFTVALTQHLWLTFVALLIAIILGLLFGIISSRVPSLRNTLLMIGNIGRTIPSLAVLALALPMLGVGPRSAVLALVLIGTLPVFINTVVGIEQVDEAIKEAARGMGMNDFQVLVRVELPIAIAVIMAGIRTSAVLIVASATLAAFVGGGGLGDLILRGHALNRNHIMLAGAIPATLLAFYFEETFGRLEAWATPKGLKIGELEQTAGGPLSVLAAIATLPVVFGVLLPWTTAVGSGADVTIPTGLHEEFRVIGVPVLVFGLLATLWPRRGERGQEWPISLLTSGAGVLALLWMLVGFVTVIPVAAEERGLGIGIYVEMVTVALIAVITLLELVQGRRGIEQEAQPKAEEAIISPAA